MGKQSYRDERPDGLLQAGDIIGDTFTVVDGDDGQLKLRSTNGHIFWIAAGDHELYISTDVDPD